MVPQLLLLLPALGLARAPAAAARDSGYCPMKCAQVTIEDDAPVTVATRVSRVNNEQHCFVLEDS